MASLEERVNIVEAQSDAHAQAIEGLRSEVAAVRSEMATRGDMGAVRTEMGALRAEMADLRRDMMAGDAAPAQRNQRTARRDGPPV